MAILEYNLECDECGKIFDGARGMHRDPRVSYRILCNECLDAIEQDAKHKWLKEHREGKTLEQRIAWLEEWVYLVTEELSEANTNNKIKGV